MINKDIENELNLPSLPGANGLNGLYRSFSARYDENLTIINYYFTEVFPADQSLFVNPIQTAKDGGYFFNPFEGFITNYDFQEVEKYLDIIFNKFDVDYFVSTEMIKVDPATFRPDAIEHARYLPTNLAAYEGKLEFFKFFINKGFDINSNYKGMITTPFYEAARGRKYEIIEYIMVHTKFDPKKPSIYTMTPLMSLLAYSRDRESSYIDGLLRNLIRKIDDENYLTERFEFAERGLYLNLMEFAFCESDYRIFKLFTNILKEKNIILGISTIEGRFSYFFDINGPREVKNILYCKLKGINIDFLPKIKSEELNEYDNQIYVKVHNIFNPINQAFEYYDNINLSSLEELEKIFPTRLYDKLQENFIENDVFEPNPYPSEVEAFIIEVIDIYKEEVLERHSDAIIRLIEANKDNHQAHEQLNNILTGIIGFKAKNFGEVIEIVYDKLGYNNLKLLNQTLICFFEDIALGLDNFQAMEADLGDIKEEELNVIKSKIEKFASYKPYGYLSYIQSEKEFNDYSKINYILALNQAEVGNNILTHIQAIQTQEVNNDLKKFINELVYNYDNSMTDGDKEACLSYFHESAINDADKDDGSEQDNIKRAKLELAEHNDDLVSIDEVLNEYSYELTGEH